MDIPEPLCSPVPSRCLLNVCFAPNNMVTPLRKLKSSRPEGIHDDLKLTFNLSLEELNEASRRLYVSLAIFKEDEATPQAGIEQLWHGLDDLDAASTTDLLDDLAARALLEVTSHRSSRVIRLHDLLHDLIDIELNDERIAVHQALLRAYRVMSKGDSWHTVDDDGYLYDNLTYHLYATGAMEELKGLFVDQGWLHVRVPQRDYTYDGVTIFFRGKHTLRKIPLKPLGLQTPLDRVDFIAPSPPFLLS